MPKILFLTTTPTIGGNGDTLINTAIEEAKEITRWAMQV